MASKLTVNKDRENQYDILLEGDFGALPAALRILGMEGRKAVIVTDDQVGGHYAEQLKESLEGFFSGLFVVTFPAGEPNKNLDTVTAILRSFVEYKLNRHDVVLALGGGVVGDVAGFCAAVYMRGIDVVQIPTSLLAMVDSSIGGKTGVDLDAYKNMVGAFKMPRLVYINTSVLKTLDGRQFASGMAEVMKYGLIMDASFYEWIITHLYEIRERREDCLSEMIEQCCICKQKIVERDPLEKGDRALLNFGHTIGHAIEKFKNFELLHGECVALGSVAAAYISWKKDKLSMDEYYEIRDMFVPFGLPISIEDIDAQEILKLTHSDKKALDDKSIRFVLLKRVGKAYIDTKVTEEEILAGIAEIEYREDNE
ncbi:MAG: 3-dehydroquinate synthase [Lachnospiraceae bacterium]|nr:3-dehydroquinate synthase [Lachnospiraceae bacterium]